MITLPYKIIFCYVLTSPNTSLILPVNNVIGSESRKVQIHVSHVIRNNIFAGLRSPSMRCDRIEIEFGYCFLWTRSRWAVGRRGSTCFMPLQSFMWLRSEASITKLNSWKRKQVNWFIIVKTTTTRRESKGNICETFLP